MACSRPRKVFLFTFQPGLRPAAQGRRHGACGRAGVGTLGPRPGASGSAGMDPAQEHTFPGPGLG
eukprot:14309071-Alexandrium_andersonii.AAC.1